MSWSRKKKWLWFLFSLILITVLIGFGLVTAVLHVPSFYETELAISVEEQREDSDKFLSTLTGIISDSRLEDTWHVEFTEKEVNAWLAVDVLENHKHSFPNELSDPRVSFDKNRIRGVAKWADGDAQYVFQLQFDLSMKDTNELVIRIRSAQVGLVPLPLEKVIEQIKETARKENLPIHWQQIEGDPVAIISLTKEHVGPRLIESIQVSEDLISISGSAKQSDGEPKD